MASNKLQTLVSAATAATVAGLVFDSNKAEVPISWWVWALLGLTCISTVVLVIRQGGNAIAALKTARFKREADRHAMLDMRREATAAGLSDEVIGGVSTTAALRVLIDAHTKATATAKAA